MKLILFLLFFYFSFCQNLTKDGYCNSDGTKQERKEKTDGFKTQFCCRHYQFNGTDCNKCKTGFMSDGGLTKCRPCNDDTYGEKCADQCSCSANETCNNVEGCVTVNTTLHDKSTNPSDEDHDHGPSEVIIYMSSIAAAGMLFVFVIALCKFRHRLLKMTKPKKKWSVPPVVQNRAPPFQASSTPCATALNDTNDVYNVIDEDNYTTHDFDIDEGEYI